VAVLKIQLVCVQLLDTVTWHYTLCLKKTGPLLCFQIAPTRLTPLEIIFGTTSNQFHLNLITNTFSQNTINTRNKLELYEQQSQHALRHCYWRQAYKHNKITLWLNIFRHYPTLAPPGGLTLHIEKLLNSSFSINLLCLKDLANVSYIYISHKRTVFTSIII